MKTGAIILAAGQASRFGAPKQLLEWEGSTLIDRACELARDWGCRPVLRVLGAHHRAILDRPCPEGIETFFHPDWKEGMGSSLAAGAAALLELDPDLDAVLVLLADQPHASRSLLDALAREIPGSSIALCDYGDAKGPPAIFSRAHFGELLALEGDQGAKPIVKKHAAAVATIPVATAWDIDSPAVWRRFILSPATSSEPGPP